MVEAVNKNLPGVFPRASGEADRDTQPPKTTMAHAPIFGSVYQINDNNKNYQRSTEWCAADYRSFFGVRHIMWPSPMTLILGVTAEREGLGNDVREPTKTYLSNGVEDTGMVT